MGLLEFLGLQLHLAAETLVPEKSEADEPAGASQHDDEEQAHQEQLLVQDLAHGAGYFLHRGHHRHPPEIVRRVLDLRDPGDQALVKPDGGIGHQLGDLFPG